MRGESGSVLAELGRGGGVVVGHVEPGLEAGVVDGVADGLGAQGGKPGVCEDDVVDAMAERGSCGVFE